ncbi:hypothetical protein A6A04_06500 [Paramagnetospirillum marisnigri]|uniref:DUF2794 domain-containing protein n=1 Tax=Paramagnetospirillum marisnigri TaxID=1285242 RepID=A0A178MDX4_9PROT|nr:DUF2794 domain-containing protein [Paramagnetospirillum marisnigri]OAN46743.1 hypothetical protein A6A04_06500 [Paramagnetospirillum marisnigri]
MSTLVRMAEYKAKPGFVRFEKSELSQILALYAGRVANGDWRDYAIDIGPDEAAFSVYRHTLERPLFTIAKDRRRKGWVVRSGGRELARADRLADILPALGGKPRGV